MTVLTLACLMILSASPLFAFNLIDAANAVFSMQCDQQLGQVDARQAHAYLLNSRARQSNSIAEQAVGGAVAMLLLARNSLSSEDYGQLTKAVPGLDLLSGANALGGLSGLGDLLGSNKGSQSALDKALGNDVQNRSDLDNAFKALGMDIGMIGQFAPLILQYLGQQGIAGSLLQNLGSLWTAPAPLAHPSV
ncbi:DUF2780 domain-containing protein [Pseudomonas juntendi]|uniref:DUF2780 domain-containing protein n=1 Tax=Pseudomonas juntendi TaxID=2666183 RepID=UPI001FFDD28C|nr:DUF2780 domain-containing protein [Pseudomonas juntendi]MCK2114653.1 DUF2780 domain-containing protein [Pseudomonas juntendi]